MADYLAEIYEERKRKAMEKARAGEICQVSGCVEPTTTIYLTPHGDWFFCDKHNEEWQTFIRSRK